MDMLSDDHKRYNVHLAKVNRKKNDLLDAEREAKKAARENDQNDTQAIFTQFSEDTSSAKPKQKCSKYLRANLRATVRWKDHVIGGSGPHAGNAGKATKKQMWKHKWSGHRFCWQYK